MKKQDIDRLKAFCEKEGFEVSRFWEDGPLFQISKKKDPWDGCEFVKAVKEYESEIFDDQIQLLKNKIYIIEKINDKRVGIARDETNNYNSFPKDYFTPSTETEYVDQLKKECFERFGEIKKGDRFDRSSFKDKNPISVVCSGESFSYDKDDDTLWFGGAIIYQSGQWATKLPERVEIKITGSTLYATQMDDHQEIEIRFESSKPINKSKDNILQFITKQLEKYLNDEQ